LLSLAADSCVIQYAIRIYKIKICKHIILSLVLYGCETWSLTLREERRLRIVDNRLLRRIFELKRDEVTEEWRRLHNEELNDIYCSPNATRVIKSRRMRGGGHVTRMGERSSEYRILVGESERKRPLGRPRRKFEDKNWDGGMDWINLAHDRTGGGLM